MGYRVEVPEQPCRIVSLVPSQTELLFDLGLKEQIVGITRFCIHPEAAVNQVERIGGTKAFDLDKIKALKPDLIIGNKEENYPEGIEALKAIAPVWMSDISRMDDALNMIVQIGNITNKAREALEIKTTIEQSLSELPTLNAGLKCAYFIWRKPYMVAASGTFIDNMLHVFGVQNAFAELSRYPTLSPEQISAAKPDLVFLSSEPYAFGDKHLDEFREMCPGAKVMVVDGELFSWYGSRLRLSAEYFKRLRMQMID
jgi:ABC-type Fe3+-hydroxamate transport system substrate-binding protein